MTRIDHRRIVDHNVFSGKGLYNISTSFLLTLKDLLLKSLSHIFNCLSHFFNLAYLIVKTPLTFFVLLGDSMNPAYQDGDLIIARQDSNVKIGDVIVFEEQIRNNIIIHRVIDQNDKGYITRGDANLEPDSNLVPHEATLGKVSVRIPKVGKIIKTI